MSLVNHMLRDLEERQDTAGQPLGVSPVLTKHQSPKTRGSKLSLTIGLGLFACAAVLLSWHNHWWKKPGWQNPTESNTVATTPAPQRAALAPQPSQEPAQLEQPIDIEPEPLQQPEPKAETVPQMAATPADIIEPQQVPVERASVEPEPSMAVVESPAEPQQAPQKVPQPTTEIAASSATEQRRAIQAAARKLLAQGNLAAASERLQSIRPNIDKHPEHYALLAGIYHKQGQHQQAAELYGQLVDIERSNAIYWLGLAVALDAMQDRNALGAFQTTHRLNDNPDVAAYVERRIQQLNKRHREGA